MNEALDEVVAELPNAAVCDMREIVTSPDDLLADIRHYRRHVYLQMAKQIRSVAASELHVRRPPPGHPPIGRYTGSPDDGSSGSAGGGDGGGSAAGPTGLSTRRQIRVVVATRAWRPWGSARAAGRRCRPTCPAAGPGPSWGRPSGRTRRRPRTGWPGICLSWSTMVSVQRVSAVPWKNQLLPLSARISP